MTLKTRVNRLEARHCDQAAEPWEVHRIVVRQNDDGSLIKTPQIIHGLGFSCVREEGETEQAFFERAKKQQNKQSPAC